ncbi:DNA-binding protein P3A2 isoform X1 [Diorhabda carinulata]|uniref:DNA-binding protein P3A2 isoform X1 n=1 Tax=Diorhabda carinulata TaxID=1163345 RepID=UPI0025A10DB9|nr:DNA-binding protein P3A2 isoform X1 [Diorhabda carinulata]XP_057656831.1 DNA-binding protein P3A2 isoform X1 [Diorhabda carinulata]XP_057656838.1 DNA-binding protein P3A2 isoform X1 [Diorhabda carinulata]XP_057656844.1 DNA-binding protein P3A2 isoform X1 [Diorhabda carinulata]
MVLIMNNSNGNQNNTEQIAMVVGSPSGMSVASDDDDNSPSSPGSAYEEGADLMAAAMGDEVTAQLAAAGPVGVAAAAAIVSSKKRKRPHSFETNPSIRKRQQNRLLRKLRQTIDEFATRVGQQAIVLVATPGKPNTSYKVFGAKPLEDVIKNLRGMIMEELENALAHQAPPPIQEDPTLFELPPLIIDGIPTPVEKMTQAQLRAFIPLMLKYSTGRGKPGWGRESTRPPWWPKELPWANVRMDARSEDEKQKISWTHALRQIVINCYKFHGREDLLPAFTEEDEKANAAATANANITTQYTPTVLHTITNPDGTVSIVQVDPNNPIITLPDGTTAHVQGMATLQSAQGDGSQVHAIQTITEGGAAGEVVDLNSVTEATLNSEGQIILTAEDGHVSGVITVPVTASMYQTMVANIQHLHTNSDGTVCVTPVVQVPKVEPNCGESMDTLTVTPSGITTHSMMIQGSGGEAPQVLQVLSLKDATVLTKAMQGIADVKTEETIISDQ